jgi:iron complex transport system permease protein
VLGAVSITLMCGAATAVAGPIVFVGLCVPHMARAIAGPDQRWVLAYSALLAPVLLLTADIIGRIVISPSELEVGIVTALIGAPVFIALVRRKRIAQL